MSTFAVVFLCIQACLVQNVFSQCLSAYAPAATSFSPAAACGYGAGLADIAYPGSYAGYPTAGYASAYPATGYANAYPATGYASAYPSAGYAGAYSGYAPYGGAGEGNVAVYGELPVAGNTAVAGQVPIMGAVRFDGAVPAAGSVAINGNCACGCGSSYYY